MKILSTVCEVQNDDNGQITFHEVKGESTFETVEEAIEHIKYLIRKNKDENISYTIIPEYIKS